MKISRQSTRRVERLAVRHSGLNGEGRGFTLIELLVTMAIILLLSAVLLPALSRGKALAKRTQCLSLMRQWAVATHGYTEDHDGNLPREGYDTSGNVAWNTWGNVWQPGSADVWYNALAPYMGTQPASNYMHPSARESFYGERSLFHCPSAKLPRTARSMVYPIALFSIAMNSQLIDFPNVPTISITRVRHPSMTVLFLDNLLEEEEKVIDAQASDNLGQPSAYANRFAGVRHSGRTGNLAFVDGHVESMPGTKVVETQGLNRGWAIVPPVDVYWEPDR